MHIILLQNISDHTNLARSYCGYWKYRSVKTLILSGCREHSRVMATELLQPLDLACGTLFQFSCTIQTSPTDCLH